MILDPRRSCAQARQRDKANDEYERACTQEEYGEEGAKERLEKTFHALIGGVARWAIGSGKLQVTVSSR